MLLLTFCCLAVNAGAVEIIGSVSHPALGEISGIVKSTRGDFYWVHNDSGDSARVFALDADSVPLKPDYFNIPIEDWPGHAIDNAWNYDWEDLTLAGGVLYLADVGNNDNARRDMGVYVVAEPDPTAVAKMRALKFIPIRYPDQQRYPAALWHFDCEAVFAADGKLYFLTKHRQPGQALSWEAGTKLYRLDTEHLDRENVLTFVSERADVTLATGAELSPDGSRLAVATYVALWIFERPAQGDDWLAGKTWKLDLDRNLVKQLEAVAWENDTTLRLVNENRDVMRAKTYEFSLVVEP